MLIRVMYTDNSFDMVRPEMLDLLLEKGSVCSFLRRDGWVMPEIGNMRQRNSNEYSGSDRRLRRTEKHLNIG